MDNIKYFLKFGEKEHIKQFANGKLYFSCAKKYQEIEKKNGIKGQGDTSEAGFNISFLNVKFGEASNKPTLCLFAVFLDDCVEIGEGKYSICLSDEIKNTIITHFPQADSVAIISNPKKFVADVTTSLSKNVCAKLVEYCNKDGQVDCNYLFKVQNNILESLFYKDKRFINEQEFRIVLPNEDINDGIIYDVVLSEKPRVISLKEFFDLV